MKVLFLFNEEIKVNIGGSVLNGRETGAEGFDLSYEINPKSLLKAVREVLPKGDIEEIVTAGLPKSERKFRKIYANTIDYLEKQLNLNREGLPPKKEPEKKTFDITEKDREILKKKDVSKLEIAYVNFKPKAKKLLFNIKARWKYLRDSTYFKKKIPVYENDLGFAFEVLGIKFFSLEKADKTCLKSMGKFLEKNLKENKEYIVKEYDTRAKTFIANRVPLRTDEKREVIRKAVQTVAVIAFVAAGSYLLYNSVYKSAENTAIQSEIQSIYYDGDTSKTVTEEERIKNFKKLKDINSEIVAWINVPHTNIDYPVLFHKEDTLKSQYYLYNNYEKNYSDYGSIFIDFRSEKGAKSKNVVMHGHHMMDGSMFSNLLKYGKTSIDMDFYKKSPTFTLSTPDEGDVVYKIISVFKTTGDKNSSGFFNYIQGDFGSDAEFMNYVYNVRVRSMVNCPVDVNEKDKLATLSTCSYEVNSNYRTVVVGRKVRAGESKNVISANAKKNPNPYFPNDFYWRFGGTQPKISTFKSEYKKGNIDWYDGRGKLKGKEALTGGKFVQERTTTTKPSTSASTSTTKPTTSTTKPKPKYYTVKFLDSKGKVISSQRVKENSSAKPPKAPKKASTKYYKYSFIHWSRSYRNVKSNITVKPIYRSIKIPQPTKPSKPKKPKVKPTKPKPTAKPKPTTRPVPTTRKPAPTKPTTTATEPTVARTEVQEEP